MSPSDPDILERHEATVAFSSSPDLSGQQLFMKLPRVKPELDPFRTRNRTIRIGGYCFGVAAEIDDETGSVWSLLELMNGSRSVADIVARVIDLHPGESPEAVRAAIDALTELGYIEDSAAPAPAELTDREKERYDRSRGYFRFVDLVPRSSSWVPQMLLRSARVTVVGIGGIGSHAAMALAASGVGFLQCVDMDTVEISNLNRQLMFTEQDIGRLKVAAAVERLRQLNSDIEITGQHAEISGVADLILLARDCDVLVLGADKPKAISAWTNLACLETATPWVDAAYGGPLAAVGTYVPGQGACWQCVETANRDRDRLDNEPLLISNPVIAPSAGIAGYLAANAVMSILTGSPHLRPGRVYVVNLVFPDASFAEEVQPQAECDACGPWLSKT